MERCVNDVKGTVDNPYAVCYASITKTLQRNKKAKKSKKK